MTILVVASSPTDWPFEIANVEVVDARSYLTHPEFSERRGAKVINLCRSYRYQSTGYYVSLLAEARGHKPLPNIATLQDLKTQAIVRMASEELEELIQKSLAPIKSDTFTLSIYFGRNTAKRYERLSLHLFNQFQSPLLRAEFARDKKQGWQLRRVVTIAANEVPQAHWPFVIDVATKHFAGRGTSVKRKTQPRFDLAILHNPDDPEPPSDDVALRKFVKAAESAGMSAEMITRDDYGRIAEFDALFIRDTTNVNHYTYRFSRRAASEGLVVIDDPQSIVRCTNKVYLAELMNRHNVPTPRTIVVHPGNVSLIPQQLGFPCVLKKPDSSFSLGVVKVETEVELEVKLREFFTNSDLVVAQEFVPTVFDWRIGILDLQPLFAAKYYMAKGHWQIVQRDGPNQRRYGRAETVPVELAPRRAVKAALKAANLIGDGLYGVDVKQSNGHFHVIEVNDNPNVNYGYEDRVLKDDLYRRIIDVFLRRVEHRKARVGR